MKNEKEVRAKIAKIEEAYNHVLILGPATTQVNAPRALMQQSATSQLDALYDVLGEKRPRFVCDDEKKLNR